MATYKDKVIFITGGSTGIGLGLAKQLAREGAKLGLFARSEPKLLAAKQVILSETPNAVVHLAPVDATNYDALEKAFEVIKNGLGTPDVVINCVGRAYPDHFENIKTSQMEDTMKTNFGSVWNASQLAFKLMKAKGGKIVNTSSIGGFVGVFGYTDYSASKFAIVGFSEALKQELKRYNIQVQVLCPPDTETPGFETENLTKPEETKAISASAKLMKPDDVAKEALKGIKNGTFMIIPGFDGKLTYFMKRHLPFIVNTVMDGSIKKAQGK